jgi:hypothetical protein
MFQVVAAKSETRLRVKSLAPHPLTGSPLDTLPQLLIPQSDHGSRSRQCLSIFQDRQAGRNQVDCTPASPDIEGPIQCSVIHGTLAEYNHDVVDHYVALSYAWGDETDKRAISIEGKRLEITASLDCALRHIRVRHSRMLRIWADGICINQSDVDDRNLQVAQMGSVYSTAHYTITFLGLSSPECDLVLQILQIAHSLDSTSSFNFDKIAFETTVEDAILTRP